MEIFEVGGKEVVFFEDFKFFFIGHEFKEVFGIINREWLTEGEIRENKISDGLEVLINLEEWEGHLKERVIFILEAVDFEVREGFYFILEFFGADFSWTNAIKSEIFIRVFRS